MLAERADRLDSVVGFIVGRRQFYDAAWAQTVIGLTYYYQGRYDEAIHAYQKALPLYERITRASTAGAGTPEPLPLVGIRARADVRLTAHFRQALELPEADGVRG